MRTPLLALGFLPLLASSAVAQKVMTLEQGAGRDRGVSFSGRAPSWRFASDGEHIVSGRGDDATWISLSSLEEIDAPTAPEEPKEKGADSEEDPRDESRKELKALRKQAAKEGAEVELIELAPDDSLAAFVEDNDLILFDPKSGERREITTDGSPETFNGKLDWVYQEEVYGRGNFKAFWWSPDAKYIAFLRLDESAVHEFTLVDHIEADTFRVRPEIVNYPKSGDPNPSVQLGVLEVESGEVRWIDLAKYEAEEPLIVRVDWTPEGDKLLFMVQDRIQSWLDLNAADPATGEWATWIEERSDSWVDRSRPPHWLEDGSFLWLSDRTGKRHVYHYRPGGELLRAVTEGDFAVSAARRGGGLDVDEERGLMWFGSTKDGAVNANTYRIGLDGSGFRRLTQGDGRHTVRWNDDRSFFIDSWSSLSTPPSVRLCNADGKILRELGVAEIADWDEYQTSTWELHEIAARDGFKLDVAVLKPVPFDPATAHPVWISTYSGPNAPTVRNGWNSSTWFQYLAEQGICVLQVNVRSASGKGHDTTSTCYERAGIQELSDIEDAVAWLTKEPWADADRVGITGHSYGGFMTAFALTHSDKFALGVAGSGVYDWGMYDTIYTERYMNTPQNNPEGYEATSVLKAAKNLSGHLVITHGTIDDNVHAQNAIQLIYALQKAGKDFDFMLYPESRHGIRDADLRWHRQRLEWNAIREHLKPRGATPYRYFAAVATHQFG